MQADILTRDVRRSAARSCLAAALIMTLLPYVGWTRTLECTDPDDAHRAETTATSAPEIKIHQGGDLRPLSPAIKPLTLKALRLAKEQRAASIQRGIEDGCTAPQVFVGEIPEARSGCEYRVISRPGEGHFEWVQVVAMCKYEWSCCAPSVAKAAGTVSMMLEGPLAGQPVKSTSTTPSKPSK